MEMDQKLRLATFALAVLSTALAAHGLHTHLFAEPGGRADSPS